MTSITPWKIGRRCVTVCCAFDIMLWDHYAPLGTAAVSGSTLELDGAFYCVLRLLQWPYHGSLQGNISFA